MGRYHQRNRWNSYTIVYRKGTLIGKEQEHIAIRLGGSSKSV